MCYGGNTTVHCYSCGDCKSIYARIQIRTLESSQMPLEILIGFKEYWIHYFGKQCESNSKMIISGSRDFNWGGDLDTQ